MGCKASRNPGINAPFLKRIVTRFSRYSYAVLFWFGFMLFRSAMFCYVGKLFSIPVVLFLLVNLIETYTALLPNFWSSVISVDFSCRFTELSGVNWGFVFFFLSSKLLRRVFFQKIEYFKTVLRKPNG